MMNAVISGRAGLALVIEGESLMSLDVDDLETLVPRSACDLRFLLADATDLVTLENTGREEIARRLDLEHDIACALDMTLIALDSDSSMELRAEAVAALDELLADARVIERLEFTMYAKPLPDSADLMGALFCTEVKTSAPRSFFERLSQYQTAIRAVREAWDELPDHLFGDEAAAKTVFQDVACHEGLFRLLALSYGDQAKVSAFLLESPKNRSISSLGNHRDVVQRWSAPIRNAEGADAPVIESDYDDYGKATETPHHSTGRDRRRRRELADVVLRSVESQKELIVTARRERDLTRTGDVRSVAVDLTGYELLKRCLQRPPDEDAWREFVYRYHAVIKATVGKTLLRRSVSQESDRLAQLPGDLIDDLVQVVYLRLVEEGSRALDRIEGEHENSLFRYLEIISINVVRDHFRAYRKPKVSFSLDELLEDTGEAGILKDAISSIDGKPISGLNVTMEEIESALDRSLGPKHRDRDLLIFKLRYFDGLTPKEIRNILGLDTSVQAIALRLSSIKSKMSALLTRRERRV